MATKPLPFTIPSPQEVLAAQRAQRQQLWASGNVAAMHQATVGNALDAVFGNPDAKRARLLQERVQGVERNLQPVAGEGEVGRELRRLSAIRDAVSDLDPAIASQVQQSILQLEQVQLERNKLQAQTVKEEALTGKAVADTQKSLVTAQIALNEDAREEDMFPLEQENVQAQTESSRASASSARQLAAERARERVNWMNPETGHMVTIRASQEEAAAQLEKAGYVVAGKPTLAGSKEDVTGVMTGGDVSKERLKFREQAVASAQLAGSLGAAMKMIDSNPNAGTLPADITTAAHAAKQNLLAAFRSNGVDRPNITKEGVSVDTLVGSSLPRANAQLRGMVTTLIYAQARAADPGGRLSNQDVEMFAKQFGNMNPQQMRDTMARLLIEGERNLGIAAQALGAVDDPAYSSAVNQFKAVRESASPAQGAEWQQRGNVRIRIKPGQ